MTSDEEAQQLDLVARKIDECAAEHSNRLVLAGLCLSSVPDRLFGSWRAGFESLRRLDLRNNGLISVPNSLAISLPQLHELRLQDNAISCLPDNISDLMQLKVLLLQRNCLEALPPALYRLKALEQLNVAANSIRAVSAAIEDLARLTSLDLSGNALAALPETIANLAALQFFDASDNEAADGRALANVPAPLLRLQARGQLLRSKGARRNLVRRALGVRSSVRAAYLECVLQGAG